MIMLRKEQARQDWHQERNEYRRLKKDLIIKSRSENKLRGVRRELKRIGLHYNEVYREERARHEQKVQFLVHKYKKRKKIETRRYLAGSERRNRWLHKIATGSES